MKDIIFQHGGGAEGEEEEVSGVVEGGGQVVEDEEGEVSGAVEGGGQEAEGEVEGGRRRKDPRTTGSRNLGSEILTKREDRT